MSDRIGERGYKISLLTVCPGKEEAVAEHLRSSILSQTHEEPVCLLKIFGKYDLCAIYRSDNFLSGASKSGSIPYIRGGKQVFAFHWGRSKRDIKRIKKDGYSVFGLLFLKINRDLLGNFGGYIENVLVNHWFKARLPDVSVNIFGTTGWSELLFLVNGQSFQSVTDACSVISQQSVVVTKNNTKTEDLFSAKTYSIFGIDFELIKVANVSDLKAHFPEPIRFGTKLFPIITITCPPINMREVFLKAKTLLGQPYSAFGENDFFVRPSKCSTWGELVYNLIDLRKQLGQGIYSTSIELFNKHGLSNYYKAPLQKMSEGDDTRKVSVTAKFIEILKNWGPIYENRLLNLYFGIANQIHDPLLGEYFEDVSSLLNERLPQLLEQENPGDPDIVRLTGELIEVINHSVEERINGAFPVFDSVVNVYSPTRGGIQRILLAANYLPQSIYASIGMKWKGFVISGFLNQGFSSHFEVINLPFEDVFLPENWWGLFHEIGHTIVWDTSTFDFWENKIIRAALKDSSYLNALDDPLFPRQFLWEIIADSFDLYFCQHGSYEVYIKYIWNYLQCKAIISEDHYLRYFSMYMAWKYLIIASLDVFPNDLDLITECNNFFRLLNKHGITQRYTEETYLELVQYFPGISPVIEEIFRLYKEKRSLQENKADFDDPSLLEAIDHVREGRVYLGKIKAPELFILKLNDIRAQDDYNKKHMFDFGVRLAAILSLWHSSKTTTF